MGRKGIGKLAPFGICTRIEILSAGGDETDAGYPVSHFVMDYDKILADEDTPMEATYRRPRTRVEEAAPAVHREAHASTLRVATVEPPRPIVVLAEVRWSY